MHRQACHPPPKLRKVEGRHGDVEQHAGRNAVPPPRQLLVAGAEVTASKARNQVLVVVTRDGSDSGKILRRRVSERADWQHERDNEKIVPKGSGQVHVGYKGVHQGQQRAK